MSKLFRITLAEIDDLVTKGSNVDFLGKGVIRTSRWMLGKGYLRIENPKEIRILRPDREIWGMYKGEFLEYVDGLLTKSGLYLVRAKYEEMSMGGFFPHKITGEFYIDKVNSWL